jgi:hypothetical protein
MARSGVEPKATNERRQEHDHLCHGEPHSNAYSRPRSEQEIRAAVACLRLFGRKTVGIGSVRFIPKLFMAMERPAGDKHEVTPPNITWVYPDIFTRRSCDSRCWRKLQNQHPCTRDPIAHIHRNARIVSSEDDLAFETPALRGRMSAMLVIVPALVEPSRWNERSKTEFGQFATLKAM